MAKSRTASAMIDALAKRAKLSDRVVPRVPKTEAELIWLYREKGVPVAGFGGITLARDVKQPTVDGRAEACPLSGDDRHGLQRFQLGQVVG